MSDYVTPAENFQVGDRKKLTSAFSFTTFAVFESQAMFLNHILVIFDETENKLFLTFFLIKILISFFLKSQFFS